MPQTCTEQVRLHHLASLDDFLQRAIRKDMVALSAITLIMNITLDLDFSPLLQKANFIILIILEDFFDVKRLSRLPGFLRRVEVLEIVGYIWLSW